MRVLITGIAGFIGFHLKEKLESIGIEVSGIDNLEEHKTASIKRASFIKKLKKSSIHSNFIDETSEKPDILIHLAAETGISGSLANPSLYFRQNVEGTFSVLEQCRKNGVKYLIYASSSSVYEPNQAIMSESAPHSNQLSFYGTSKRLTEIMVENYCHQFGITAIGLRFFTVYGSWTRPDMAAYKFMKAISDEQPITLYNDGNISRDFTHVSDIVHAISLLVEKIKEEKPNSHQIFNIGSGRPISVKQYAELIAKYLNKTPIIKSKPLPNNELEATYSDTSKLNNYIQFRPISTIDEGVKEMTDWYKNNQLMDY
ncbi:MAG: NAD-dependent epimerase/dehydratase family protein [Crocinitomicaceae bacterium]|nr:NAD-dependent epimerase/dehydratase family protein [Crocinitomicaceae bacterium]